MTFGDPAYDIALVLGNLISSICLFMCLLSFLSMTSRRSKSLLLFMVIHNLYSTMADAIFSNGYAPYYLLETLSFFSWAIWIMLRPEIKTAKTINKDNILLAFYKGDKGSFTMHFFELFGLPVKSMCILAGDKALYLKSNKKTFQFGDNLIHRKANDYIIVDTGVPFTEKYIELMKEHANIKAKKGLFRIRCIEAVSDLLELIGEEYKPTKLSYIPSFYLRRILNVRESHKSI